jgi:hypothetical protein
MASEEGCGSVVMIPIIAMGLSYGMYAGSVWTAIIYVVDTPVIGVATGIVSIGVSLGICITQLLMGVLMDDSDSESTKYFNVCRLSTLLAIIGLVSSLVIYYQDKYFNNGVLSMNVE